MNSLKDAIIHKPSFAKTAGVKLPKDSMEWNEMVIKQFYSELSFMPKEYNVDAVINSVDDKAGYAKGSVVVWDGNNKINFPIIIKDWELSAFDTFTQNNGEDDYYRSATESNVKSAMSDQNLGEPTDVPGMMPSTNDVKRPGDIIPKTAIEANSTNDVDGIDKVSFDWKATVNSDDFEKFAEELRVSPGVQYAFNENNPGLLTNTIDEINNKRIIPNDTAKGVYDVRHFIKRKQMDVVTDDQIFNKDMLRPVKTSSVAELRINLAPTLEDVMTASDNKAGRLVAAANGISVKGAVVELINPFSKRDSNKDLFLSKCGKYYATKYTYNGSSFYGVTSQEKGVSECLSTVSANTTDDMLSINLSNSDNTPGLDKTFPKANDSIDSYTRDNTRTKSIVKSPKIAVVYGAGEKYQAFTEDGPFKKVMVEGREVYIGKETAIIKANVALPVKAKTTEDPVYRAVVGDKELLLIPEASLIINLGMLTNISDVLMEPSSDVKENFRKSSLNKVAVQIGKTGFRISGDSIDPLMKIASLKPFHEFSSKEAETALYTMGMSKEAANTTLQGLVKKASLGYGNSVEIYGVNNDYIDLTPKYEMQKEASVKILLKDYANSIKVNLVKEASIVEDPEAVDNILSLNFINEDNITEYSNYTQELRETSDKLSELLIANRMGLKDIDEAATKKAIDGLEGVIKGLNKLKMVVESK